MRIDIKTVKGKDYVQFIDELGHLHHLGPAKDFDSWLAALYLWDWECQKNREKLFESVKAKVRGYINLDKDKEREMWRHFTTAGEFGEVEVVSKGAWRKIHKFFDKQELCRQHREAILRDEELSKLVTSKRRLVKATNILQRAASKCFS
jgi:hypothetical protein